MTEPRASGKAIDDAAPSPRTVGVLGGGTAGYLTALAIKRRFPDIAVTVVESPEIPIIGVGEATTTLMPPFLHAQLGLSIEELFRDVRPTFKLGIRFEWGPPGKHFNYPFGDTDPVEAMLHDGELGNQSLVSMLMDQGHAPLLRSPEGEIVSLLPQVKFAYHLDNAPFVAFLKQAATRAGIGQEAMTVLGVTPFKDKPGVAALRAADARELSFDLYVDASGFRSTLLEGALGSPFLDYSGSLLCDRAIVGSVDPGGSVRPFTTAETMDAGWCWRIPVRDSDHRGYVFSSAFLTDAEAASEMRTKNPTLGETRVVHFRSGRHRDFWQHNVVAIGNAYAFVEPLESTALHMVIVEIAYLLAGLEAMRRKGQAPAAAAAVTQRASEKVGAHWDYLRWFLALHYRFNGRLETAFWKDARARVDVSGMQALVARFQSDASWLGRDGRSFELGDPAFGFNGVVTLLLGQGVACHLPEQETAAAEAWRERVAGQRRAVRWALPQVEALAVLARTPRLLEACTSSPRSWVLGDGESFVPLDGDAWAHPKGGMPRASPLLRAAPRKRPPKR